MFFRQLKIGPMDNFCYIVGDEKSREAAVVDPAWNVDKLIEEADKNKLKITHIIITHTHPDHINGVHEMQEKTQAIVYVHEEGRKVFDGLKVKAIKDNDVIKIGNLKVKVLHTPGHIPDAVCYLAENKLITGDTLFVGCIGRLDLPGGDAFAMKKTLERLKSLDDDIKVYPGHDYGSTPSSTIGREKKTNHYLKGF